MADAKWQSLTENKTFPPINVYG